MRFLLFLPWFYACAFALEPGLVGAQVCAQCHRAIFVSQSKTRMGMSHAGAGVLSETYRRAKDEGGIAYSFNRRGSTVDYGVTMPERAGFHAPVETMVGGTRHGYSFLVRVPAVDGIQLPRAPLVEARYLHYSPSGQLELSPGFPHELPVSWETSIGRVLSPDFERKCLDCHGAGAGAQHSGVTCENCHGPGSGHLKAIAVKSADKAIVNPRTLSNSRQIDVCAQCHAGFGEVHDPVPDDLLISNQVAALRKSQCYIQSRGALTCTTCHDPHRDSPKDDPRFIKSCLGCHNSKVANRAALCPVNQSDNCLKCHMPEARKGAFAMVDHWIRVHPEQGITASHHNPADVTQTRPERLYLRWIVAGDRSKAEAALQELEAGSPFFSVAQKYSSDPSAISGGFLGDMAVSDMDPALAEAALHLSRGGFSKVVNVKDRPTIVYRMPRDYLYAAEQLQLEATRLRERRDFKAAAQKYLESLQVYPYYLRSLIFLAVSVGEQGQSARAAAILELAARLYPNDPAVQYNLGIAYGASGRAEEEIQAYRRAIAIQVDLIPAYLNLGSALYAANQLDQAAEVYRRGLEQNPLAATLYYNLGQVYRQQGKPDEAAKASQLAAKIDSRFAGGGQ